MVYTFTHNFFHNDFKIGLKLQNTFPIYCFMMLTACELIILPCYWLFVSEVRRSPEYAPLNIYFADLFLFLFMPLYLVRIISQTHKNQSKKNNPDGPNVGPMNHDIRVGGTSTNPLQHHPFGPHIAAWQIFHIYYRDIKLPNHTFCLTVFSHIAAQSYVRYMMFKDWTLDKKRNKLASVYVSFLYHILFRK